MSPLGSTNERGTDFELISTLNNLTTLCLDAVGVYSFCFSRDVEYILHVVQFCSGKTLKGNSLTLVVVCANKGLSVLERLLHHGNNDSLFSFLVSSMKRRRWLPKKHR